MRVSSPPVGTISSASDVTDALNQNSKRECGSAVQLAASVWLVGVVRV
jgi:hypothetical protein